MATQAMTGALRHLGHRGPGGARQWSDYALQANLPIMFHMYHMTLLDGSAGLQLTALIPTTHGRLSTTCTGRQSCSAPTSACCCRLTCAMQKSVVPACCEARDTLLRRADVRQQVCGHKMSRASSAFLLCLSPALQCMRRHFNTSCLKLCGLLC